MNKKIPVRQFAEKLASECGVEPEIAQQYIKTYFDNVTELLRMGEDVDIAGLGNFSVTLNSETPVTFTPDADAAAELNSPFEMFEPTELPEGIGEEDLVDKTISDSVEIPQDAIPEDAIESLLDPTETENLTETPEEPIETSECKTDEIVSSEHDDQIEQINGHEIDPNTTNDNPENTTECITVVENETETNKYSGYIPEDEEEFIEHVDTQKNSSFGLGFLVGILTGLIIGATALFIYAMYYANTPTPIQ